MSQYLFEKNAKKSRIKALLLTIIFHLLIIAAVFYNAVDMMSIFDQSPEENQQDKSHEDHHISGKLSDEIIFSI